jgi:predicted ArsR family transcriptional regulator
LSSARRCFDPGRRQTRHVDYELTPKGRGLFPRAHEPALNALLDVLRERLSADQLADLLKHVGRKMCATWVGEQTSREPRGRLAELFARLKTLTAGLSLEQRPDGATLRACGCPLASVTASHPEVCRVLADVVGEVLGMQVRERCDRKDGPRCCFELDAVT